MKVTLTSTNSDLRFLDRDNLIMNNILVTDDINKSMEPLLENESDCLLITDKIINEQSSIEEIIKSLKVIYELYPKEIRIIYVKLGVDIDGLVDLMDEYNNWDVHYNTDISKLTTEELMNIIEGRKLPTFDNKKRTKFSNNQSIITTADEIEKELTLTLLNNKEVYNNDEFKHTVYKNLNKIKSLLLAYGIEKELTRKLEKDIEELRTKITVLTEQLKQSNKTNNKLSVVLEESEKLKEEALTELRRVTTAYNKLVESIKMIINPQDIHSSLVEPINIDDLGSKVPTIIYVKEHSQIRFLTTFLNNFSTLFNETVGVTKLLVIESDLRTGTIPLYAEKEMVYVTEGTNLAGIILGNLVTCGVNVKLLHYLVNNSLNLDYLIIFDRTGYDLDYVKGNDVINFHVLKNPKEKKLLGIDSNNIITDEDGSNYILERIKDYDKLNKSYDTELSLTASLDLTKKLTAYIKEWENIKSRRT